MSTTAQVHINGPQATALADLIGKHEDGEGVLITPQGRGDIYVAFSLVSFTITADGEIAGE